MNARTNRWTTDLLVVLLLTVIATGVVLLDVDSSPLRTAAVAPILILLPGYALVAAIYPERAKQSDEWSPEKRSVAPPGVVDDGLSPSARLGLSVAASIAIVPAIVLALNFAAGTIAVVPTLLVLAPLTVVLTLLAFFRRARLPEERRMGVPPLTHLLGMAVRPFRKHDRSLSQSSTFEATTWRGLLMNVLLVASVLALVSSVGVAYVYPTEEQGFTELYLTTETDDGEFVAENYPTQFSSGESQPLFVTVTNREGAEQSYTIVAELQRIDQTPNGTTVAEETELTRFTPTVGAGETARVEHDLQPTFSGGRLRVQYLLYQGEPPEDPTRENAYRDVQLMISVGGGGSGGDTGGSDDGANADGDGGGSSDDGGAEDGGTGTGTPTGTSTPAGTSTSTGTSTGTSTDSGMTTPTGTQTETGTGTGTDTGTGTGTETGTGTGTETDDGGIGLGGN
ncbi:DUF1616 domain-containing protein (plasmid) [Halorarum halophilum]|uniref:DUF1616 domain-containing protein n=1 Tax=Halorarum halophilum TaxID=2743090 RepID=A0A7D5KPQ3_9EURY|nr:DUF1616 domain-containing protein [Halobaculum halophilum]QLG29742.1 DUF1616 domain-containing protein [Halobaculum halophilum]